MGKFGYVPCVSLKNWHNTYKWKSSWRWPRPTLTTQCKEFLSMQNNHRENTVLSDVCSSFKWKLNAASFWFVSSISTSKSSSISESRTTWKQLRWVLWLLVGFSPPHLPFLGSSHFLSLKWQACKCSYLNPPPSTHYGQNSFAQQPGFPDN